MTKKVPLGTKHTWYFWNRSLDRAQLMRVLLSTEVAPKWALRIFLREEVLLASAFTTQTKMKHTTKREQTPINIKIKIAEIAYF
jgi:hypothetical protein